MTIVNCGGETLFMVKFPSENSRGRIDECMLFGKNVNLIFSYITSFIVFRVIEKVHTKKLSLVS